MNKNIEEYKEEIDSLKVDENLKKKTIQKAIEMRENKRKSKFVVFRTMAACAACLMLAIGVGYVGYTNYPNFIENAPKVEEKTEVIAKTDLSASGLKKVENEEQLKKLLEKNSSRVRYKSNGIITDTQVDTVMEAQPDSSSGESKADYTSDDYSKTNTQHENVDEADIIKTDGKYIYYLISNRYVYDGKENKVVIIGVNERKVVGTIKLNEEKSKYYNAEEMFLYNDKLILMYSAIKESDTGNKSEVKTGAEIYDISNREDPKKIRDIRATGDYVDARMVGANLYFISNQYNYYYYKNTDILLPTFMDTIESNEDEKIECTDIYYLEDSEDSDYTQITAVNVDKDLKANTQTFLGLGDMIYSSEDNLYIVKDIYNSSYSRIFGTYNYETKSEIFKFRLIDNNIEFVCKGEVDGTVKNQFSLDEYDGYLRVATTGYTKEIETSNNVFILDKNLKNVGKIEGIEKGEKIYSVRFMGNVGYVVTFVQTDPLLVIDLKDPMNPKIKGELKIPGYSSYLHPYDENHIIGIGMNTKTTDYGAVTTTTMKMSMFDVSDLKNPKEIFKKTIGTGYSSSEALYNHKAILCSKEKEIIALPISSYAYRSANNFSGAIIYKVDLENKKFEELTKIYNYDKDTDYENYNRYYSGLIKRILYIGDLFYTISDRQVKIISMNDWNIIDTIDLEK